MILKFYLVFLVNKEFSRILRYGRYIIEGLVPGIHDNPYVL